MSGGLGSRTTAPSDKEIEAVLASNWIAVPFGDPTAKHDSDLPRKLARRCVRAEEALRQAASALASASTYLDEAGMQVASSDAHTACHAALAVVPPEPEEPPEENQGG